MLTVQSRPHRAQLVVGKGLRDCGTRNPRCCCQSRRSRRLRRLSIPTTTSPIRINPATAPFTSRSSAAQLETLFLTMFLCFFFFFFSYTPKTQSLHTHNNTNTKSRRLEIGNTKVSLSYVALFPKRISF